MSSTSLFYPSLNVVSKVWWVIRDLLGPAARVTLQHQSVENRGEGDGHRLRVIVESRNQPFTIDSVHLTNEGEDPQQLRVVLATAHHEEKARLKSNDSVVFSIEELHMAGEGESTPHSCLRGPFLAEVKVAGRRSITRRFSRRAN